MNVVAHPEAERELHDAILYFEDQCEGLGREFEELVIQHANALPSRHRLYRHRPGGYQRVNLPRFPYYLPYVIRCNTLFLLAIAHTASRPEYWVDRTPPSTAPSSP